MATENQIEELYRTGKYREVIEAAPESLRAAWAHYQLGEVDKAKALAERYQTSSSAELLLGHVAERQGRFADAEMHLRTLSVKDRAAGNLYVIILVGRKRQGEEIVAVNAMTYATEAMMRAPHQIVDGHIINNVAWLLHQVREQKDVQKLLPILPGLAEMAIGIYEAVGAAPNHRAAVQYRAALIFEAAGWLEGARTLIRQSVEIWRELVVREGGDRFQQNLRGAEEVARRLNG